jgi:hypothetical protein
MKKLSLMLVFAFASVAVFAQGPGGNRGGRVVEGKRTERVEAFRVGYYTQQLNLTVEESKAFWPIFNEFQDKMQALRKSERRLNEEGAELSDKELEEAINQRFDLRQKQLDLEKEYYQKFKTVLPIKKVAQLPRVEREFRTELLKKMKDRAGAPERPGRPERPPHPRGGE